MCVTCTGFVCCGARGVWKRDESSRPRPPLRPRPPPALGRRIGRKCGGRHPTGDWSTFDYDAARSGVAPSPGITSGNLGRLALARCALTGSPIRRRSSCTQSPCGVADVTSSWSPPATAGQSPLTPAPALSCGSLSPAGSTARRATPGHAPPRPWPIRTDALSTPPRPTGCVYKLSLASGQDGLVAQRELRPRHEKMDSALNVSWRIRGHDHRRLLRRRPALRRSRGLISRATGRLVHVWNTECSNRHRLIHAGSCTTSSTRSAIWGRAGTVDRAGQPRILTATGNGAFNGRADWGDSVTGADRRRLASAAQLDSDQSGAPQPVRHRSGKTIPALVPATTACSLPYRAARTACCTCSSWPAGRHAGASRPAAGRRGSARWAVRAGCRCSPCPSPPAWRPDPVFVADEGAQPPTASAAAPVRGCGTVWSSATPGNEPHAGRGTALRV